MKISGTEIEIVTNPYGQSATPIDSDYDDVTCALLVKGVWNSDLVEFMREKQIKGLYLNYAKGFTCDNFDFLLALKDLELLNIIYTPVETLGQIKNLENIKSLSISCHWKDKLDLSGLKHLERCFIGYAKGAESIFYCDSLRYLYIDEFRLKSYEQLKNLSNIEYLTIGNSSFNEPEIFSGLKKLRKLVLLNCRKLDHLDGLGALENLEWLTIDGSKKISTIEELSSLKQLKVLQLSNNKEIETLLAIKGLTQLKALSFFGDTVINDGDLSFLETFKSLSLVGFAGRRHYTHKPARSWNWNDFESGNSAVVLK
jgi:Leucine-rich repeat (LRR) protein